MTETRDASLSKPVVLAIVVAALGYLVDIYDLVLFSVVRVPSLKGLGITDPAELLSTGAHLLNMQMTGMLVGGILWGVLGDKRGRLSVLFGSIFMYSMANIANGFVTDTQTYAVLRFVAGVGLAGELGAGVTLVSEVTTARMRGYATTIVAGVGICGAVLAAFVADLFPWRTAYYVGGGLGLALLALRIGLLESGMFSRLRETSVARGNFFALFSNRNRARRYLSVVLVGVPIWYAIGVLVTFSPELGKAMGMTELPSGGRSILFTYIGLALGDFGSGWLSQMARSRKRAIGIFLGITIVALIAYFTIGHLSLSTFYGVCLLLGIGTGYWAVFVTVAAEQFGTNLRATSTTTAPNFVRGAVVPLTASFRALQEHVSLVQSAAILGVVVMIIAFVALFGIEETYGKDLDFLEE